LFILRITQITYPVVEVQSSAQLIGKCSNQCVSDEYFEASTLL